MEQPIALVTGGAGLGIGSGVSSVLAQRGWHVVVADLDMDAANETVEDVRRASGCATPVRVDVSDPDCVEDVVEMIEREHGPIAALVNSAGTGLIRPLADVTPQDWDQLHGVDLRGAFLASRAVLKHMVPRRRGAIVNIGSVQALGPHVGYSTYAAAKAGLIGLTKGIAADYGEYGIRCSIVHPGLVDSPQNRELFAGFGDAEAFIRDYLAHRQMIPRLIQPREIGNAVAYLLSDDNPCTTAAELVVDGGSSSMAFDRD